MEAKLQKESVNSFKKILDTVISHEETAETIVPDALPDILRITGCYGTVLIRGKTADSGSATITGMVGASVIYTPEGESSIRKLEVSLPFSATAECGEMQQSGRIVAAARLAAIDARMLNPRKILVRADVVIDIKGYSAQTAVLCGGLEAEIEGLEVLVENPSLSVFTGVREKSFVISDDFTLPPSNPPIEELLDVKTEFSADDIKAVGNKLIFKGTVSLRLLYRSEKDGSVCAAELTSSFSQIMEADTAEDDARYTVTLFTSGTYFDVDSSAGSDRRIVTAEMHLVAQAVAVKTVELKHISDLYSTAFELDYKTETMEIGSSRPDIYLHDTLKETMRTNGEAKRIIDFSACAGRAVCERADGVLKITQPVNVNALYMDENDEYVPAAGSFELRVQTEISDEDECAVRSSIGQDMSVSAEESEIAFKIPVTFQICVWRQSYINCVTDICCNENETIDLSGRPSVVLRRADVGESLWQIAKSYCSTVALINSANELSGEDVVTDRRVLLIPKKR